LIFPTLCKKLRLYPSVLAIPDYHGYLAARSSFKRIQVDGSTNGDDARLSENYPLQYPLFSVHNPVDPPKQSPEFARFWPSISCMPNALSTQRSNCP
jgi:hypothetical protein